MNRITRHIRNGGSTARTLGPARPYRDSDPLNSLPYWRARFIKQRRAGHELRFTEYGWLLKLAMKPVTLPKVTPAESYIARMRRVDPMVAEVLGPVFDAMFPARAAA